MRIKMQSLVFVLLLGIVLACTATGAAEVSSTVIPVCFIQNNGQADEQALFFADSSGYTLYLTRDGQILSTADAGAVSITYPGAGTASVSGEDVLEGKANFFIGNDQDAWVTDVPMYSTVRYQGLYDGITLVYHGGKGVLKREFIVAPGADPAKIQMVYAGQDSLILDESGAIMIGTPAGTLFETTPLCYQVAYGKQVEVPCRYIISGNLVTFSIGSYDPELPLIIDPMIDFSTYLGGTNEDRAYGVDMDNSGNVYIAGATKSTNFPLPNASIYQEHVNGSFDVFVAKLSSDGQYLYYSTYIGGFFDDKALALVVNNESEVVTITGYTDSPNYPNTTGITKCNYSDVFVTRLNEFGSDLVYSTLLGGNWSEAGTSLAIRPNNYVIVVGYTGSDDFNVTTADPYMGLTDAFAARFDNNGNVLECRFIGGTGDDYAYGVALDSTNRPYIAGATKSVDFPSTTGAFRTDSRGLYDAFIARMNADVTSIQKCTYLGSTLDDFGTAIALGPDNYPYITGYTESPVSPINLYPITPGANQTTYGGGKYDAFITKMDPDLTNLNYSTYLGGYLEDRGYAIAVDNSSLAYVTGWTKSDNFPTQYPLQPQRDGLYPDAFVTIINETGQTLLFSTFLGGSNIDEANGIAISEDGLNITVTGSTESGDFPRMRPYQGYLAGYPPIRKSDAFITKIVRLLPVADFNATPERGCVEVNVSFRDNSTGNPTAWLWEFEDGGTSPVQNPYHVFTNPTSSIKKFTVNLTVWNNDGSSFKTEPDYIWVCPNPFANFSAKNEFDLLERGCLNQNSTIQFNVTNISGGPLSGWNWSFGDGNSSGVLTTANRNATWTYTNTGYFTVNLTYKNPCCNNTTVKVDFIDIREKPVAFFNATPTIGVWPLFVQFFDNSTGRPSSWEWDLGPINKSEQHPNYTYTVKNNYTIKLTVCNFCDCNGTKENKYIKVGDPLVASFIPNRTSGFAPLRVGFNDTSTGDPTSWAYDFGDNTTSVSIQNATHIYTVPGVYGVTLNVSNIYGYNVSSPTIITVKARGNVTYVPDTLIVPTNTTTKVNLTLDQAEYGLAGYNITVYFADINGGNFTSVEFPGWASNLSHYGPLPAPSVSLDATDFEGMIDPGATNIPLAYFKVKGQNPMPTFLNVTINQMADDIGGTINPRTVSAKVTVVNLLMFPGATKFPIDPDGDQKFYDIDGRNGLTFNDVVLFYRSVNTRWIDNQYAPFFNFDNNNGITFNDVVTLFRKVQR